MLLSLQYSRPIRVVVGSQLFRKSVVTKPLGQVCGPNVSAFSNVLKFFLFFFQLHINHENFVFDHFGSYDCIGNVTFYWARWVNGQDAQNQWCISWTDWKENSNGKMKMSRDSADFGNLVSVFEIYRKFLELENVSLSMRVNFQKAYPSMRIISYPNEDVSSMNNLHFQWSFWKVKEKSLKT